MPSPLTVLLIAIAGVFYLNGLTYVLSLAGQRKDPLKALFGILCLLGSGYALACDRIGHAGERRRKLAISGFCQFVRIGLVCNWNCQRDRERQEG